MTTQDEAAIAWAVGLFEGEGCISSTSQCNVQLRVGMTDEDVVRRFLRAVRCGSVSGPHDAGEGRFSHIWVSEGGSAPKKPWTLERSSSVWPRVRGCAPDATRRSSQRSLSE